MNRGAIAVLARLELRQAARHRWLWSFTAGFALVAALLTDLSLPSGLGGGGAGVARATASLVALVQLLVPLMGLLLGAQAFAPERRLGVLRFSLAHPVTRGEVLVGSLLGLGGALVAALAIGFGLAGALTVATGGAGDAGTFLRVAGLAALLGLTMLAVGTALGAWSRRPGTSSGVAVFAWLCFVVLGDLGLMGAAVATALPVPALLALTALNPVEAFRLAGLAPFPGALDALGPAGGYAMDRLGSTAGPVFAAVLVIWLIGAVSVAWWWFSRRGDR